MNKQEVIQEITNLAFPNLDTVPDILKLSDVIKILNQLDEPQIPVIPQIVAEWIEDHRMYNTTLLNVYKVLGAKKDDVSTWVNNNLDLFARAWLDGYTIEREKLYIVTLPNTANYYNRPQKLCKGETGNWFFCGEASDKQHKFTESEIRKGFDWAWQAGFAKEVE